VVEIVAPPFPVAVPERLTVAAGSVIVWSGPAPTVGGISPQFVLSVLPVNTAVGEVKI